MMLGMSLGIGQPIRDWLRRLPPNVQGALWLVSGGFIFTSTSVMIRLLSTQIESVQTAFFRAFLSVVLLLPMIAAGRVKPWTSKRIAGHFWRTAMGTASMVLGFYAVSMLPLADATAIAFSQPLFSVVVAALVAGEKVRWRRWSATVIGFVGVLVMVRPGAGSLQLGALVALANAASVAVSIYLVKRLSNSEAPLMILTQFAIFSTLLLAVPAVMVWRWPDVWGWLLAVGVALSATVGQYFWVQAFKSGEMSAVAPFEYLRLPFAVFVGWLIWSEMPEIWTYVGAAVVIASALYIAHREAQLARQQREVRAKRSAAPVS
jgi:drug/metabolite transporter (DMT)-like permease